MPLKMRIASGIPVSRLRSHKLRHTCVQRLMEASFSLKIVKDCVGHSSSSSTEIYTNDTVISLIDIASGDREVVLSKPNRSTSKVPWRKESRTFLPTSVPWGGNITRKRRLCCLLRRQTNSTHNQFHHSPVIAI